MEKAILWVGFIVHIVGFFYAIWLRRKWKLPVSWFIFWINNILLVHITWRFSQVVNLSLPEWIRMILLPGISTISVWGTLVCFNTALRRWSGASPERVAMIHELHKQVFSSQWDHSFRELDRLRKELKKDE